MDGLFTEKCILVADFEYFPIVLKLKALHPEASWKIVTKDDLLDRASFSFARDPIPYLMSKSIDYSNAKKYLRLLRVADYEQNEKLKAMFDELEGAGFIKTDDLGSIELSRSKIVLLESQNDFELHEFLKRKSIGFTDATLEDLGAKKKLSADEKPVLLSFPNKYVQYNYIYSQIRKEMLEDETLKDRITILVNDESDLYYVKIVSSLYRIPSFAVFLRPFLSNPSVKKKVAEIYRQKSFEFTEQESVDDDLAELRRIVIYYGLPSLPFDFAYASLLEITNTLSVKEDLDDRGITIENRFVINPHERIFVTNFQYDVFYKVFDDKNVLTDQELVEVSANPSYVLTRMDRQKKLNYIQYNEIPFLSRVRQHLTDKIYDSQFLSELGWDPKKDVQKVGMNPDGAYTSEAGRIYLADQLDKQFYPKPYGDYRNYDHSFKGLNQAVFHASQNWSVTNLEKYIQCPFKYYLTKVLPDYSDDRHAMWLGILIHKVMERVLADDFDFDEEFSKGIDEYKKAVASSHQAFGGKEETWIEMARYWLKVTCDSIRLSKDHMQLVTELAEQKVTFVLTGSTGQTYTFANAKIDKILVTEKADETKRFYTIIDYKSGQEKFEPKQVFLGPSSQLPLYYHAMEHAGNKDRLVDATDFGGFGIVHCYASSPKKITSAHKVVSQKNVLSTVRIKGLTNKSLSYWKSIDKTGVKEAEDGDALKQYGGNYLAKVILFGSENDATSIIAGVGTGIVYNLGRLVDDAKLAMVKTIEKILANDFAIRPTSIDLKANDLGRLACSRCPYGDICYKNIPQDHVSYAKEIYDYFHPGELGNEEGEEAEEDE